MLFPVHDIRHGMLVLVFLQIALLRKTNSTHFSLVRLHALVNICVVFEVPSLREHFVAALVCSLVFPLLALALSLLNDRILAPGEGIMGVILIVVTFGIFCIHLMGAFLMYDWNLNVNQVVIKRLFIRFPFR